MNFLIVFMVATQLVVAACNEPGPQGPSDVPAGVVDLRIRLPVPEYGYQISSAGHIVKAGTEAHICDVVKFVPQQDEKLFWLAGAESRSSDYTHHMNVHVGLFSVLDAFLGDGQGESMLGKDLGQYDCEELGDLMQEQNAFPVYPSQITHQVITFPQGVAVPGITPLVMVMEHHYINLQDKDVMVNAAVNFYRVDEVKVEHILTGFYGGITPIELPPNSGKIVAWTCAIDRDLKMVAIGSHSHRNGDCFTINEYSAQQSAVVAEPLYVNYDWHSPPILTFTPGEWEMPAGNGIHWACHYNNRENRTVKDGGSANDEMCIFVAVGYPNRLTVDDVKAMIDDPLSVDVDSVVQDAMVKCEPIVAESPYADTDVAVPGGIAACADLSEYETLPQ